VLSRRSRGISLGINLNVNAVCSFNCAYCQVDRTVRRTLQRVELNVVESELRHLMERWETLFNEPEFQAVPKAYQRLNDIAFSGDGEPTASAMFPQAAALAATVRRQLAPADTKIVVITNACHLDRAEVIATLALLDENGGEIWAKLDAGTEAQFQAINRTHFSLEHVLNNLLATAQLRPIVIQSLFMRLHGQAPSEAELNAYVNRLHWILEQGGRIKLVQVYSVARRPAESYVTPLENERLEAIAASVRSLGIEAEVYA
jgi:wyosine [tRNA(Phe)-imidazoG37] synthetase (radical SAM superfamily)